VALIKTVALRAQILLKTAYGSKSNYADYDYIINFIGVVNSDINNRFQALGLNYDTQVVVLTNVPANTTDLSSYQADGGLLANLVTPDSTDGSSPIEWRLAGQSDTDWQPVPMSGKVFDTNTAAAGKPVASDTGIVESFEFRGGIIYLSPCNQVVDLRVRGDFLPSVADDDAASFIKGALNVFVYWTCEMISALGPGKESSTIHDTFVKWAQRAEDDFVCLLAKSQLSENICLGGPRTQWVTGMGGGFTPPIVG
jgi:hypothetical protein